MRGLVTVFGGSGFIGGQVVRALAKQGARIRVAVRRPWQAYRLRLLGEVGQIEIVQANVRVAETVSRALIDAEAVVYAAGTPFQYGAQTFASVRAEGPGEVAAAAAAQGIARMAMISGIGASPDALAASARAVAAGEAAARAAFPGVTILRPSVVFGPDDAFFNKLAQIAALSPVMPVFGGGEARIQPVFVADVARAVAAALSDPATAGRTYELGGPAIHTYRQLVELVLAVTDRRRTLVSVPWGLAGMLAAGGDLLAALHGPMPMLLKPPLTTDQLDLLRIDNVASGPGLAELGVTAPVALEAVLPSYLYRYRKGGQYAELTAPEPLPG
ncbi:MAG TPA: complex I NDUFA9 subunit family protein [Caulobacteraceae bacterium]|jgi:NADH dehydrogenase